MRELCDCGKEESEIATTDDGDMCGRCFGKRYSSNAEKESFQ